MNHMVTFRRYDFSTTPAKTESKTISIEFPEVTDENIDLYEQMLWDKLFEQDETKPKDHFSSWLIDSKRETN